MGEIGKMLMIMGVVLVLAGLLLVLFGKLPNAGKLPGDILIKKENFSFYFPFTTCLIISIILSIISMLWFRK